jgi:quercetin dioxygenase-like cupin family protein
MIRAVRLYIGSDGASHVAEGTIATNYASDVTTISFAESEPHASFDWHTAPRKQFVVTLSGTLEFTTHEGETFVLRPGDVLVAEDTSGTGHKWRLLDDQPWRRVYVGIKDDAPNHFVATKV